MSHVKHVAQAIICALVFGLIAWLFVGSALWNLNITEWSILARCLFSSSWLIGLIVGCAIEPGGFK